MVALQILVQHRNHADWKIPGDPARNLEESQRRFRRGVGVPLGQLHHVLDARAHRVHLLHIATDAVACIHIAQRRVFPPRHKHRKVLLGRSQQPAVLRVNLIRLFQIARQQNLEEELVRKEPLSSLVGTHPFFEHFILDAPHRFHLGDARIGHAVHVPRQQLRLVRRCQVAIVGNALIEIVRHKIENIFFKVGARAANPMNLVLANHLGERQP